MGSLPTPKPDAPAPSNPATIHDALPEHYHLKLFVPPAIVLAVLVAVSIGLWKLERWDEARRVNDDVAAVRTQLAQRIDAAIASRTAALKTLAGEILADRVSLADGEFDDHARLLRAVIPEFAYVAWVSPDGRLNALLPSDAPTPPVHRGPAGSLDATIMQADGAARQARKSVVGDILPSFTAGDNAAWIAIPILPDRAPANYPYGGTVLGCLDVTKILDSAADQQTSTDFVIQLRDLAGHTSGDRLRDPPQWPTATIPSARWTLAVEPAPAYLAQRRGGVSTGLLLATLAGSFLVTGIVFQTMRYRLGDERRVRLHVAQLGAVSSVAATISARLGAGREVLDGLTDAARDLLRMSTASIWFLSPRGDEITVVSATDTGRDLIGSRYQLTSLPGTRYCIETGRLVDAEDVARDKRPLDWRLLDRLGMRSLLMVPLRSEGRTIGVLLIGDARPRRFTDADRNLARLWGSQAAAILANQRLYEQKDAALANQRRLTEQRDVLYQVSASIYQHGSLEAALKRVTEVVPAALEVDVCSISLTTERRGEAVQVATNDPHAAKTMGKPWRYSRRFAAVLESRQLTVVEDAGHDPLSEPEYVKYLNVGACAYVPLVGENAGAFGMMTLVRHVPGPFEPEHLQMAEVFGARVAAAIETVRLYEQTRRDAETKEMLLRELNHRVKNNLAGIVGLLSANTPDLPPDAEQWLARATDRIRMMARAHELFGGGMENVSLSQLVHLMLPSLSVVKPAAVEITTDVENVRAHLRTDRAVSLVMVLHEICYNAIVHGVGDHGAVHIRARRNDDSPVVNIEVTDDGTAASSPASLSATGSRAAAVAAGTGLGLNLVRGIVGRELRGRFRLEPRPEGGSTATVEFPLRDEELH